MAQFVLLETSMGAVTLELYTAHAPRTCENFTTLCARKYYDDTPFHRIIANFMIQGGDPTGTGRGGASIWGDTFEDESGGLRELKHSGAGVVSMANSGRDTNASQFFVTLAPAPWLDGKHTVFGRVRSGMRVVQRMGLVKTGEMDRPLEDMRIVTARVVEGEEG